MITKNAKAFGALALIGASALVLAGCAQGNTGPTAPSNAATDAADLPATGWERADAADVKDGGELTIAVGQFPANFNNFQVDGNEVNTNLVLAPTVGGPLKISEDGTMVVDENYATSVELVSESPQVIEVKLNNKAVWEDGTPITAADWIATWKAQNGTNEAFTPASTAGWEDISSIEQGANEFEFKVTFKDIYADWQALFGQILPASVASDPAVYNDGYRTKAMPSMGPYVMTSVDTTRQTVTLEKNPKWWGTAPKLDKIVMSYVSQEQQGQSFANDEIDVLDISSNADLYNTAQGRKDAVIQSSGGLTWTHVTMNAKEGPLSDVNVRKAVASIVDREQIAAAANTPVGVPAVTQGDYIFMNGQNGYQDKSYPHDLDAAAKFLEEAGYKKDGEKWTKDGADLKLTVTVPADTATNVQRAEQVQADLADFGIPVEITSVPANDYFSGYVIPGDFEMVTFSWQGTPFPISSSEALYYPLTSESNFTGTTDDKLGDLFDKANTELDPEARIKVANEINETIWAYIPMFPVAPLPNVVAVEDGLVNYGPAMFEQVDWTTVGWKK